MLFFRTPLEVAKICMNDFENLSYVLMGPDQQFDSNVLISMANYDKPLILIELKQ